MIAIPVHLQRQSLLLIRTVDARDLTTPLFDPVLLRRDGEPVLGQQPKEAHLQPAGRGLDT